MRELDPMGSAGRSRENQEGSCSDSKTALRWFHV